MYRYRLGPIEYEEEPPSAVRNGTLSVGLGDWKGNSFGVAAARQGSGLLTMR